MSNMMLIFALLVVVFCMYGAYSTFQKKKQVYIIYHRITGQILELFASINDRTVVIDNKQFELQADRHSLTWWNRGIHSFFGTWVITYEFSWYSRFPHDPKDFKNVVVSPSVARVLNNEDRMKSFARGVNNQSSGGKKQGSMEKYLPYIIIAVCVILIIFVFQMHGQIAALGADYNKLIGVAPK